MRILYDLWASQPLAGNYHGSATYAQAVLERLLQLRENHDLTVYYDPSRWLDPDLIRLLKDSSTPALHIRDRVALQRILTARRYDRLYSALPYDYYDLDLRGLDFVMTIHGLRPLEVPSDRHEPKYADGWRQRVKTHLKRIGLPLYLRMHRARFDRLVHNSANVSRIIVPSAHTKHALLNQFPDLEPRDITVLDSPLRQPVVTSKPSPDGDTDTRLREFQVERRGYFLLVNAGRWIKNAYRAVRALDDFFTLRPTIDKRVVCLGIQKGQRLGRHLANADRFTFRDYVEGLTLDTLYREAFALLYPTLNEGFGYPPLEAMRAGTPVICSAIASLPELCGDSVVYCNPYSGDEIRNRISYLTLEDGVWARYSRRGKERFATISKRQGVMLDRLCRIILDSEVPRTGESLE